MKILIAEDDEIMLHVIERQLQIENYETRTAENGNEALQAMENFQPDLIITDIVMPLTSGLELIGVVRSSGSTVPILVLSAIDQENTVLAAISLGADDFIAKPFIPSELSMRVKKLLDKKKQ
ncbi:MAG TPA: response regulator transcription factor [Chitinophagaceae bacterium]|nr:response regulator transcription factor [Chitinophagaceae bacterium]